MKKNTSSDTLKVGISIAWACASVLLVLVGSELETPSEGQGFSFEFFLGIISGLICACYISKWLKEQEGDNNDVNPYE